MDRADHIHQFIACLVLPLAVCLMGCGGDSAAVVTAGDAQQISADVGRLDVIPPPGAPGIDANTAVRESQYALNTEISGLSFYQRSPDSIIDRELMSLRLYTATGNVCWAIYGASDFGASEVVQSIAISLDQPLAERFFVGLSDFAQSTWRWFEITEVAEEVQLGIPPAIKLTNEEGSLYICIAASAKEFVSVHGLVINVDTGAPPPAGLTASDGEYAYAIELNWEDPALTFDGLAAEALEVWRRLPSQEFSIIAVLPAGTTTYQDVYSQPDNELPLLTPVQYTLRTVVDGRAGPPAAYVNGSTGELPAELEFAARSAEVPDRILLDWTPQPEALSYIIDYRRYDEGAFTELVAIEDGSTSGFEHTKSSPPDKTCEYGVHYYYRLRAVFPTTEVVGTADASRYLFPPALFGASYGEYADRILLSWSSSYGTAVNYEIFRDGQQEGDRIAVVSGALEYEDTGPGLSVHTYEIRTEYEGESSLFYSGAQPTIGCVINDGWQVHAIDPAAESGLYNSMALADGRPAVAYIDADSLQLKLARALVAVPESSADWSVHPVAAAEVGPVVLLPQTDRLTVCYINGGIWYAESSSLEPTSSADWQTYLVEGSTKPRKALAAIVFNGRIAAAYGFGEELRYARAQLATPASVEDWDSMLVDLAPDELCGVSLAEINGLPAICYGTDYVVRFARATIAEPGGLDDWQRQNCTTSFGLNGVVQLVDAGGVPAIIWRYWEGLAYAYATSATPSLPTDWITSLLDEYTFTGSCAAQVSGGQLLVCYNAEQEYPGASSLRRAVSATLNPAGPEDWSYDVLLATDQATIAGGSLLEYSGGLAYTCHMSLTGQGLLFCCLASGD